MVQQYINFADNEILPQACVWVFPTLGLTQYNKEVRWRGRAYKNHDYFVGNKASTRKYQGSSEGAQFYAGDSYFPCWRESYTGRHYSLLQSSNVVSTGKHWLCWYYSLILDYWIGVGTKI